MIGKLRGEENDADEDEKCTEEIAEIGDEVQVIVCEDGTHGSVVGSEFVHVLVKVKHHSYAYDEEKREEVGSEELTDEIGVYSFQKWDSQFHDLSFSNISNIKVSGLIYLP